MKPTPWYLYYENTEMEGLQYFGGDPHICDIGKLKPLLSFHIINIHLSSYGATGLLLLIQGLQVRFKSFDLSVLCLQVLVQAISFSNELLFPLAEAVLFRLDLVCESFAKHVLFITELGVVIVLYPTKRTTECVRYE